MDSSDLPISWTISPNHHLPSSSPSSNRSAKPSDRLYVVLCNYLSIGQFELARTVINDLLAIAPERVLRVLRALVLESIHESVPSHAHMSYLAYHEHVRIVNEILHNQHLPQSYQQLATLINPFGLIDYDQIQIQIYSANGLKISDNALVYCGLSCSDVHYRERTHGASLGKVRQWNDEWFTCPVFYADSTIRIFLSSSSSFNDDDESQIIGECSLSLEQLRHSLSHHIYVPLIRYETRIDKDYDGEAYTQFEYGQIELTISWKKRSILENDYFPIGTRQCLALDLLLYETLLYMKHNDITNDISTQSISELRRFYTIPNFNRNHNIDIESLNDNIQETLYRFIVSSRHDDGFVKEFIRFKQWNATIQYQFQCIYMNAIRYHLSNNMFEFASTSLSTLLCLLPIHSESFVNALLNAFFYYIYYHHDRNDDEKWQQILDNLQSLPKTNGEISTKYDWDADILIHTMDEYEIIIQRRCIFYSALLNQPESYNHLIQRVCQLDDEYMKQQFNYFIHHHHHLLPMCFYAFSNTIDRLQQEQDKNGNNLYKNDSKVRTSLRYFWYDYSQFIRLMHPHHHMYEYALLKCMELLCMNQNMMMLKQAEICLRPFPQLRCLSILLCWDHPQICNRYEWKREIIRFLWINRPTVRVEGQFGVERRMEKWCNRLYFHISMIDAIFEYHRHMGNDTTLENDEMKLELLMNLHSQSIIYVFKHDLINIPDHFIIQSHDSIRFMHLFNHNNGNNQNRSLSDDDDGWSHDMNILRSFFAIRCIFNVVLVQSNSDHRLASKQEIVDSWTVSQYYMNSIHSNNNTWIIFTLEKIYILFFLPKRRSADKNVEYYLTYEQCAVYLSLFSEYLYEIKHRMNDNDGRCDRLLHKINDNLGRIMILNNQNPNSQLSIELLFKPIHQLPIEYMKRVKIDEFTSHHRSIDSRISITQSWKRFMTQYMRELSIDSCMKSFNDCDDRSQIVFMIEAIIVCKGVSEIYRNRAIDNVKQIIQSSNQLDEEEKKYYNSTLIMNHNSSRQSYDETYKRLIEYTKHNNSLENLIDFLCNQLTTSSSFIQRILPAIIAIRYLVKSSSSLQRFSTNIEIMRKTMKCIEDTPHEAAAPIVRWFTWRLGKYEMYLKICKKFNCTLIDENVLELLSYELPYADRRAFTLVIRTLLKQIQTRRMNQSNDNDDDEYLKNLQFLLRLCENNSVNLCDTGKCLEEEIVVEMMKYDNHQKNHTENPLISYGELLMKIQNPNDFIEKLLEKGSKFWRYDTDQARDVLILALNRLNDDTIRQRIEYLYNSIVIFKDIIHQTRGGRMIKLQKHGDTDENIFENWEIFMDSCNNNLNNVIEKLLDHGIVNCAEKLIQLHENNMNMNMKLDLYTKRQMEYRIRALSIAQFLQSTSSSSIHQHLDAIEQIQCIDDDDELNQIAIYLLKSINHPRIRLFIGNVLIRKLDLHCSTIILNMHICTKIVINLSSSSSSHPNLSHRIGVRWEIIEHPTDLFTSLLRQCTTRSDDDDDQCRLILCGLCELYAMHPEFQQYQDTHLDTYLCNLAAASSLCNSEITRCALMLCRNRDVARDHCFRICDDLAAQLGRGDAAHPLYTVELMQQILAMYCTMDAHAQSNALYNAYKDVCNNNEKGKEWLVLCSVGVRIRDVLDSPCTIIRQLVHCDRADLAQSIVQSLSFTSSLPRVDELADDLKQQCFALATEHGLIHT